MSSLVDEAVLWCDEASPKKLIQLWSPCLSKNKVILEVVQTKFTRLILRMRRLSYQERLNNLGLYSLEFTIILAIVFKQTKSKVGLTGYIFKKHSKC